MGKENARTDMLHRLRNDADTALHHRKQSGKEDEVARGQRDKLTRKYDPAYMSLNMRRKLARLEGVPLVKVEKRGGMDPFE